MGVLKLPKLGLLQLWSPITLWADLQSRCGLKQNYSFHRKISNYMSHTICKQINRVDSRLFLVKSQTINLTPNLFSGHNLCFGCPNEQCKPILSIYILKNFQWYKERHKLLNFNPWNHSLKFRESTEIPSPKVGVTLVVWRFIPSHFHTPPEHVMWLLGSSWPAPLQPFCFGRKPKTRVTTWSKYAPPPIWAKVKTGQELIQIHQTKLGCFEPLCFAWNPNASWQWKKIV